MARKAVWGPDLVGSGGRLRQGDMSAGFEPEADRNTAELVEAAFQQVAWRFLGSRLSINYK